MAEELLRAKNDRKELGVHWQDHFLSRFPDLKTKYISGLDKNRFSAQDPIIISAWFDLFSHIKNEFNVHPSDIYNIDEKGFMVGMLQRTKVIISKYEMSKYMVEPGNKEWVSLIECVSMTGELLPLWVIFKAKKQNLA